MNLNIAVVGAAGVGKTLFCINFAEYLGARSLSYSETGSVGRGRGSLSPAAARELMVNYGGRCNNGNMRTFAVHLMQPPYRRIALIDTASLKEKNPLPLYERSRLVLTLQAVHSAGVVLQIIDLSCADPARFEFEDQISRCLTDYCRLQGKLFLIAGNKADLLDRPAPKLHCTVSESLILISSLTRAGFPRLHSRITGEPTLLAE